MTSLFLTLALLGQVDATYIAVRAPYAEGQLWPNVDAPTTHFIEGSDLVRLTIRLDLAQRTATVTNEVPLDETDAPSAIIDVQTDGEWVFYAKRNQRVRDGVPREWGFDLFKIPVAGGTPTQLTHGEWQPPESLPYGDFPLDTPTRTRQGFLRSNIPHSTGPCLLGEQVIFTSTRDGYNTNGDRRGDGSDDAHLIYTMDRDGKNLECIGPGTLGGALHPEVHPKGAFVISEKEGMAFRGWMPWGLTEFQRDGTGMNPAVSIYRQSRAYHGHAAMPDNSLAWITYYAPRNGTGTLIRAQLYPVGSPTPQLRFLNPYVKQQMPVGGYVDMRRSVYGHPFQVAESSNLTEFAHPEDRQSAKDAEGVPQGFVAFPSTSQHGMLVTWTGPSENWRGRGRIMLIKDFAPVRHPSDMVTLIDNPEFTYINAREVATHEEIFGRPLPIKPWIANDGSEHEALPAGTPFALLGWGSIINREWLPWGSEGGQIGEVTDDDIHYVRIYLARPSPVRRGHSSYVSRDFDWESSSRERFEILADIPVRRDGLIDGEGNPDTSGWAKIPGDASFTFGVLNANKEQVAFARKWHNLRPGEVRNCGDCHVHASGGTPADSTLAYKWFKKLPGGEQFSLAQAITPRVLQYERDIEPIVTEHGLDVRVAYLPNDNSGSRMANFTAFPHRSLISPVVQTLPDTVPSEQRDKLIEWIDTGAPRGPGILHDDLRPTLTVQSPSREQHTPINVIRFGAYDLHTGVQSVAVTADWELFGRAPGTDLADMFTQANHVWTLTIPTRAAGEVTVTVADGNGNTAKLVRTFDAGPEPPPNPNQPRIDEIKARLAEIDQAVGELEAERTALLEELETLE